MAPIPQAQAQVAARWLRNQANSLKSILGQQQAKVTGRPDELTAEAARHATQADDLQKVYATISAQVRGLAQNWKGDHYMQFAREGKGRLDHLSHVVRGLRGERAHLLRIERVLRRSARGFDILIEQMEAKAQQYISQTSVLPYNTLSVALDRNYREAERKGREITEALANVLKERDEFYPKSGRFGYNPQGLDTLPEPRPQNPQGEFDESLNLLLRRINTDATSPAVQEIKNSWTKVREIRNNFVADGPLDTKPAFRRHFGMSARGDLTTPIPPDVGTIDGLPAAMPYDLLGNIHYGYLNRLAGVPSAIFEPGARAYDWLVYGKVDRADALAVRIGSELYDQYPDPAQLRPEHIRDALRIHFDQFFVTGGFTVR
jgi:uncharacterized protein YukE